MSSTDHCHSSSYSSGRSLSRAKRVIVARSMRSSEGVQRGSGWSAMPTYSSIGAVDYAELLDAPTVADVDRIAARTDRVVRNLLITQTYSDLAAAVEALLCPGPDHSRPYAACGS